MDSIIITTNTTTTTTIYLFTYSLTAIECSLRGSSPYTITNKTNKNKYTQNETI